MPFKYDFKEIATDTDIYALAKHLQLNIGKDNHADCPACDGKRKLQFFEDTNSFHCYGADFSGDAIDLYVHLNGGGKYQAARFLKDTFNHSTTVERVTHPTRPEGGTAKSQPASTTFDPAAYAEKLVYDDKVEALGLSQEQAGELQIGSVTTGLHRGHIAFPIRWPDGSIAAFVSAEAVKFPKHLLPRKVVQLKRRA